MRIKLFLKIIYKAASIFRSGFMFLCVAIIASTALLSAQNPNSLILNQDSLKADLTDLKEIIYESHENPFYYIDSLDFEMAYDSIYNSINSNISLAEFSKKTSFLLQRLRDSHTAVNLQSLFNFTRADTSLNLYFQTDLIESKVVIKKDYLDILPLGAELLEINRVSVNQLILEIEPYYIYEGNSEKQAPKLLAGLIPKVMAMNHGLDSINLISYIHHTDTLFSEYPSTLFKTIRKDKKSDSKSPFKFEVVNNSAFIKIVSFSAKSEKKYEAFLRKSFKKAKKSNCDSLVIDLRNNLGGNVWRMEELLSYLDGADVISPYSLIAVKSPLSSAKYEKLTKGLGGWFRLHLYKNNDKMRVFREMAANPFNQRDTFIYKVFTPKKKLAFPGTKTLFINHKSGSASVLFASAFKSNKFGITMGTPCLGPLGGTWGDATPYKMMRSGLSINLSVLRLSSSSEYSHSAESIQPDVFYERTIEDLQVHADGLRELYFNQTVPLLKN